MCVGVCTHRTVHHCCPRNRCRRHSATGCECSSRFGSETRPPRTLWELQREKGFRGQIMSMQQKQRADTELELKKRQLSLSSEDIIFTAAVTPGKL